MSRECGNTSDSDICSIIMRLGGKATESLARSVGRSSRQPSRRLWLFALIALFLAFVVRLSLMVWTGACRRDSPWRERLLPSPRLRRFDTCQNSAGHVWPSLTCLTCPCLTHVRHWGQFRLDLRWIPGREKPTWWVRLKSGHRAAEARFPIGWLFLVIIDTDRN